MHSNAPILDDVSLFPATARAVRATRQSTAKIFGSVLVFFLLVTLAAQVRIPVPGTEVPMTLQLFGVLLAGSLLSPNQSAATMSTYLVLGTAGLPVFSPGSVGLWGSTGGYLVGFIPAAWLMGVLRGRGETGVSRLFAAGTVGVMMVFVCGIGWRIAWLSGDWRMALQTGLLPFALKAMVELCLAVALVVSIRGWQSRRASTNVSECVE